MVSRAVIMASVRLFPLLILGMVVGSQGVTLYEYFTPGVSGEGITSGLGETHNP